MNFKELLNKIDRAKASNLPFVIYRKPEAKLVHAIVQKNNRLEYSDDFKGSGFIMAPFDGRKKAVLFSEENIERLNCMLDGDQDIFAVDRKNKSYDDKLENSRKKHLELVKKGIQRIKTGDFIKTVLSRSETVRLEHIDVIEIFKRLMSNYPLAFVYVWYHPQIGLWAGASPETLLKTKGSTFETMSLAGTQKYKDTIDVSWGEKERKEQKIVTEHILKSLDGLDLHVSETYTRKAGNLLHLCNDIKGFLGQENNLNELIKKLHPTAAVCGLPREEVQEFILKEEGYDRSFYTGFLGELNFHEDDFASSGENISNSTRSNLFVNLRCMELRENQQPSAVIYVGGGITQDSDPLSEWQETVQKSLIMKTVIGS